ncbi:protein S100-A12-like [Talpa occidentalis]|uniref:protein S100-A12-like n=1 Tax=Talpa occidentalis TaxID=50954 RepID=UPI00188E0A3B|nr:protein S100-A12-like [Talpa occidentalis]XP_054547143.1 protein S100-A12-like [Talpa occidentalis]
MTKLEDYLEGIINIYHQYSVRVGNFDTLSKSELKRLITKELTNTLKSTKDQPFIDKIFKELDADGDGQVDFKEFVKLVTEVLVSAHDELHDKEAH